MGIMDGVSKVFSGSPGEMPIYPPGNPEYQGMYAAWEAEDMTGTAGIALDNSSLLLHIESFLSGRQLVERTDPQTGKKKTVWEQIGDPKMNQRGIASIMLLLRSYLDKNTIMTHIDKESLLSFMDFFSMNLAIFLGQNVDEFEIRPNYLSHVSDFIVDEVYVTLLRGLDGNEKQGVYKQSKRIENYQMPLNSAASAVNRSGGVFR